MTSRNPEHRSLDIRRGRMWTGDVWRTALLLKLRRPDLVIVTVDAAPTGLVLITHLNPDCKLLDDRYDDCVAEMLSWSLQDMGLSAYHDAMAIKSTRGINSLEDITSDSSSLNIADPPSRPRSTLEQTLVEAISHHHAGRIDDADRLYRAVLASPLAPAVACFNFGLLCMTQEKLPLAIEAYRRAISIQPDYVDAYVNLGTALLMLGQHEEAAGFYRHAIVLNPENAMAHGNLGKALQDLGRIKEAIAAYRVGLAHEADNAAIHLNLGAALLECKAWTDAVIVTQRAIDLAPANPMAYANLGTALLHLGRHEQAEVACRHAIALQPQGAAIHASLGGAMLELGALQEAVTLCRRAIALDPSLSSAQFNLSHAFKGMNQLDAAELSARKAIALDPDSAEYHFHLAHILLLQGNMAAGWLEYEWRLKLPEFSWIDTLLGMHPQPQWTGEDISDKTILIYAEQGLGDIIQFARYLPMVVRKAGRVIVAIHPPLRRILQTFDGITTVSMNESPLPAFDIHCPLMSLPRIFETRIDSIPAGAPYLHADPVEQARWLRRLGGSPLRVGIVWAGNPATKRDRFRSPGLASVSRLFSVPGVDFVVLQVGPGREDYDVSSLPPHVLDLGKEIADLAETAAIMTGLDLMISSCTAPVHLAGALGVPTWAMIPFAPHFPWLLKRTDTPWYPTMHLYRQEQSGEAWFDVIDRIAIDLAALAESKSKHHHEHVMA